LKDCEVVRPCPFCDYVGRGRHLIKNGDLVIVIASNPRLVAGHALVIPKRHVVRPSELSCDERAELFDTAIEVEELVTAAGLGTGCMMLQNLMPFLPQSRLKVDHVHIHLIPRTFQDELWQVSIRFQDNLFQDLLDEEFRVIREKLCSNINN
jgi:diadenosine tetraphosphate (Ap4A) HIT family hydrolase